MLSQTVLLKGINDDAETLAALMRAFVEARVKPYYLHHLDLAPGTSHFRTTIAEGQALDAALRGRLSGIAQPTYVLDIPGGHGKVPIGPRLCVGRWRQRHRSVRRPARLSRIAADPPPQTHAPPEGLAVAGVVRQAHHRDRRRWAGDGASPK